MTPLDGLGDFIGPCDRHGATSSLFGTLPQSSAQVIIGVQIRHNVTHVKQDTSQNVRQMI